MLDGGVPTPGASVDSEGEGGGVEGRLAAFDRAINALGEARAAVRALVKANTGEGAGGAGCRPSLLLGECSLVGCCPCHVCARACSHPAAHLPACPPTSWHVAIRPVLCSLTAGEGGGESALEELTALDKALTGALVERTLQRGEEQVGASAWEAFAAWALTTKPFLTLVAVLTGDCVSGFIASCCALSHTTASLHPNPSHPGGECRGAF